jgi:Flp pilus assembly protein TadD
MTDPGLWYLAGSTALEAANFPGARLSAERALEIDPQYPEGLVLLGRVLWAEGDRSGARAKFEEALALDPELPVAHTQLGMLLLEQTDFRPGLLELWTAVLLDPVDPLPHRELGHAFFSMRIPTEGVIYLERSDWLTTFLQTRGTEPAPGR